MKVFKNTEYRPKRFPGLVFRLKRPKTATLIFTTGKLVCTGAKSSKLAKRAVKKVVKQLREAGFIINDMPEEEKDRKWLKPRKSIVPKRKEKSLSGGA